jgi:hypothetical protein
MRDAGRAPAVAAEDLRYPPFSLGHACAPQRAAMVRSRLLSVVCGASMRGPRGGGGVVVATYPVTTALFPPTFSHYAPPGHHVMQPFIQQV